MINLNLNFCLRPYFKCASCKSSGEAEGIADSSGASLLAYAISTKLG